MKTILKKGGLAAIVVVLASGLLFLNTCKKENPPANQVYMQDMAFNPTSLTVSPGTTVMWTNKDNMDHTVTSNTGLFDSGIIHPGGTFSYQFKGSGSYSYHCTIHANMNGTVTVQ